MIKGVMIKQINRNLDERGYFSEILRVDWTDIINEEIVQVNLSYSYPGMIRAWHRHNQGQNDHFTVVDGSIKLCGYDDDANSETYRELDEIILSSDKPMLVRMPGYLWHGFKALGTRPTKLVYGVNRLYNYTNPDEERRPWNDPSLIPKSINGNKDDPRAGKTWDWNYPPHK